MAVEYVLNGKVWTRNLFCFIGPLFLFPFPPFLVCSVFSLHLYVKKCGEDMSGNRREDQTVTLSSIVREKIFLFDRSH